MRHRDNRVNELKHELLLKLADIGRDAKYAELVRFLIAQGLMTLMEDKVIIRARKEDLAIVKKELPQAIKLYQETLKASSGITPQVKCEIDEKEFLAPAPVKGASAASCSGGVELIARDGQIVVRNTLDHRLELAFEALKPTIRGLLFGVREVLVGKNEAPKKEHK